MRLLKRTCSQPTYEGLKRLRELHRGTVPTDSQPTYEGLKLFWAFDVDEYVSEFPAYLRGIETCGRGTGLWRSMKFPAYLNEGVEYAPAASSVAMTVAFPAYLT